MGPRYVPMHAFDTDCPSFPESVSHSHRKGRRLWSGNDLAGFCPFKVAGAALGLLDSLV